MASWLLFGPLMMALAGPAAPPAVEATRLRGEVVDADTGRPIPCRLSIRSEDGSWFFPDSESPRGTAVPYRKAAFRHPEIQRIFDQPFVSMSKDEIIEGAELELGRALRRSGLRCGAVVRTRDATWAARPPAPHGAPASGCHPVRCFRSHPWCGARETPHRW